MTADAEIRGGVSAGFEPVHDAFASNFGEGAEVGAACAVYVDGREVVNLWGGLADPTSSTAWEATTLIPVASTSKGLAATCVHLLVQRGELDLDATVATYWPEFAAAGKEDITVRTLLSHRAGLPLIDRRVTLDDLFAVRPVVEALAEQAPLWEPGTAYAYHAITFGWLVGELVRRVSGKTLGTFLADEIAGPLEAGVFIGLPRSEHHRVARSMWPDIGDLDAIIEAARADAASIADPGEREARLAGLARLADTESVNYRVLTINGAMADVQINNDPRFWSTEMPASNACCTAHGLARVYASCISAVDGIRLLDDDTIDAAVVEHSSGPDAIGGTEHRFGLGYMLPSATWPTLGPTSFGHPGVGGSVAFADRASRVAFAYVTNRPGAEEDARARKLIDATRQALTG